MYTELNGRQFSHENENALFVESQHLHFGMPPSAIDPNHRIRPNGETFNKHATLLLINNKHIEIEMHLLIEAYYTLSDTLNKFCKNIHKPNTTHAY